MFVCVSRLCLVQYMIAYPRGKSLREFGVYEQFNVHNQRYVTLYIYI